MLAEIATIATIVVVVMLVKYVFARGYSEADYAAVSQAMAKGLGIWGGAVYTLTFARRLLPSGYLTASTLKIAAGALAGFLYERSEIRKRTVA